MEQKLISEKRVIKCVECRREIEISENSVMVLCGKCGWMNEKPFEEAKLYNIK